MPVDKETLDAFNASLDAKIAPLNTTLAAVQAENTTLKGWLGRIDAENKEKAKAAPPPEPKPPVPPTTEGELKLLRERVDRAEKAKADSDKRSAITQAAAGISFVPGAMDDVLAIMQGRVQETDEGLRVEVTEKLATGEAVKVRIGVDEAMKRLAKEKPWLVQATVKPGAGMNGSGGRVDITENLSYDELIKPRNAEMLGEFQKKFPEQFAKLAEENFEKRLAARK